MRKMVGVDCDDVCIETVPKWLDVYNYFHNDNLKPEQITDWNISQFVKPRAKQDIYDILKTKGVYELAKLVDGSLEGVEYLRSLGYRVIFVTSTPKELAGVKFKFLNDRGFKISKKDYFETSDKSKFRVKYLIDDNFDNILKTKGTGILFTRAWNSKYEWDYRVSGWKEIVEKFKKGVY